jgi:hypothetical protein
LNRRKAGRPTKADLAERKRREKEWRRQEDRWRRQRSLNNRGLVDVESTNINWDEVCARLGKIRSHMLWLWLTDPAVEFVLDRTIDVPDKSSAMDAALLQASVDLLKSNVPLNPGMRDVIAELLWRLAHPEAAKRASIRAKVEVINEALAMLDQRGEKPEDAYSKIAKESDHKSGDALRKWMRKHDLDDK